MASKAWWDSRWIWSQQGWKTWWPIASMSRGHWMWGPSVDRQLLLDLWWCSLEWTEALMPTWSIFLLPRWCLLLLWWLGLWWGLVIALIVLVAWERLDWWGRCRQWICTSTPQRCWNHHRMLVVWFCIDECSSPDPLLPMLLLPLLYVGDVTILTCWCLLLWCLELTPRCLGSFPGDHCSATMLKSVMCFTVVVQQLAQRCFLWCASSRALMEPRCHSTLMCILTCTDDVHMDACTLTRLLGLMMSKRHDDHTKQ